MKIRGNAHHVAEKYLQLARDAHTSGDPVAAENYLQHAEHYFRLIAAAQAAQLAAQGRPPGEPEIEEEEEDDGGVLDRFASPAERAPQPFIPPAQPYQQPAGGGFGYNDRPSFDGQPQQHGERNNFQPRGDRPQQNRADHRPPRPPFGDRNDSGPREHRGNQDNRQDNRPREFRNNYRDMNPQHEPQPTVDAAPAGLPAFITAAPRVPTPAESLDAPQPVLEATVEATVETPVETPTETPQSAETAAPASAEEAPAEARSPRRRRRLRSPYGFHAGEEATPGSGTTSE